MLGVGKYEMMENGFRFSDELGPLKVIHISNPAINLKAILVIDNVAMGPSIGGLRMAPDVTTEECFRLARAMTLKNAAAGLKHGGGKSVLVGAPLMPKEQKEELIRGMAQALRTEDNYIFGPDMGTNEECMAWVYDEIGRSVGLPKELGGIPLDEIGATGFGLAHAAEIAAPACGLSLDGARVAVQGFGSVGIHAARFLAERGCRLVAASDSRGILHDPNGLDIDALADVKKAGGSVSEYANKGNSGHNDIISTDCDILIPAARPDVITDKNVDSIQAKLILQGANIPATLSAEKRLHERGVLSIPDFIANAGGVICAAMEYTGAGQPAAYDAIREKLRTNTQAVLDGMERDKVLPREAAFSLAHSRLAKAMELRRWSIH